MSLKNSLCYLIDDEAVGTFHRSAYITEVLAGYSNLLVYLENYVEICRVSENILLSYIDDVM